VALYLAQHADRKKFSVHLIAGRGGYLDKTAETSKGYKTVLWDEIRHPIRPLSDICAIFKLKKYFVENNIEIVHTHSSKAGMLGRLAAKMAGVKTVIHTVHGFPFHEYQNPVMHFMYVMIEKFLASFTTTLVAVGEDVINYGLKKGVGKKEQYVMIRAGVEIKAFRNAHCTAADRKKSGLDPKKFTVGMVGNLKKQKNPGAFIEIAKRAAAKDTLIQFVFAGGGSRAEVDGVNEKIRLSDTQCDVKFIGWINEPEKFIACLDVFLLTSLWEGLPCTLAQAAAAGKICVTSDIDGNREMINGLGKGAVYPPFDYDKAVEFILYYKKNIRKEKYGPRAAKLLKEFDADVMMKMYEKIY
jgi:glycosyltransferase involved in cell wall biosynthesis